MNNVTADILLNSSFIPNLAKFMFPCLPSSGMLVSESLQPRQRCPGEEKQGPGVLPGLENEQPRAASEFVPPEVKRIYV